MTAIKNTNNRTEGDTDRNQFFSGFGRSRKWRRNMAVTETTAETDGSLTAVTVAETETETETDCRSMDNDSMCTEAVEPDHP